MEQLIISMQKLQTIKINKMKKIILAILIFASINSYSQNIDTVRVSVTLRATDWAFLVSYASDSKDSATLSNIRKIRTAVNEIQNPNWNTQVTVAQLSGRLVVSMYGVYISQPFGMFSSLGGNIGTQIKAINNSVLQYHIGQIDGGFGSQYNGRRDIGKNILLDN